MAAPRLRQRDRGCDAGAAAGRALDLEPAVEDGEAVAEPEEAAPVGASASRGVLGVGRAGSEACKDRPGLGASAP
jgi:hypothetical protein